MDRTDSVIGCQHLQRLTTTGQRITERLQGSFGAKPVQRDLINTSQATQLTEGPVIQRELTRRSNGQSQLTIIENCGSHRFWWFPAIDRMILQRAAVMTELIKRIERLIGRSGKQFAGSPHKIGHGTISKTGHRKTEKPQEKPNVAPPVLTHASPARSTSWLRVRECRCEFFYPCLNVKEHVSEAL
jgi:hypothetical protein